VSATVTEIEPEVLAQPPLTPSPAAPAPAAPAPAAPAPAAPAPAAPAPAAPAPAAAPPAPAPAQLPFTGAWLLPALALGSTALLLGALLVASTRRRGLHARP
jgi:hypothetical protein